MNFLNKIQLKTGVKERNNFDLSSDHVTTSDFFRINPVLCIPTVPSGKYNIKAQTFTRLSPMTNPVLGRCIIHNRAFFVPMPDYMPGLHTNPYKPYRRQEEAKPNTQH